MPSQSSSISSDSSGPAYPFTFSSVDELEFEIAVQTVMLESISPSSETAEQDRQRIQRTIDGLAEQLETMRRGSHSGPKYPLDSYGATPGHSLLSFATTTGDVDDDDLDDIDEGNSSALYAGMGDFGRPNQSELFFGDGKKRQRTDDHQGYPEEQEEEEIRMDMRGYQPGHGSASRMRMDTGPHSSSYRKDAAQDVLRSHRDRMVQMEHDTSIARELQAQYDAEKQGHPKSNKAFETASLQHHASSSKPYGEASRQASHAGSPFAALTPDFPTPPGYSMSTSFAGTPTFPPSPSPYAGGSSFPRGAFMYGGSQYNAGDVLPTSSLNGDTSNMSPSGHHPNMNNPNTHQQAPSGSPWAMAPPGMQNSAGFHQHMQTPSDVFNPGPFPLTSPTGNQGLPGINAPMFAPYQQGPVHLSRQQSPSGVSHAQFPHVARPHPNLRANNNSTSLPYRPPNLPVPSLTTMMSSNQNTSEPLPESPSTSSTDSILEISPEQFRPSSRSLALGATPAPSPSANMAAIRNNHSGLQVASTNQEPFVFLSSQLPPSAFNPIASFTSAVRNATANVFNTAMNIGASALGTRDHPVDIEDYRSFPNAGQPLLAQDNIGSTGSSAYPSALPPSGVSRVDQTARDTLNLLDNIRAGEGDEQAERMDTPDAMSAQLMEHQKIGLAWLYRHEKGTNKGGILADDMGLGKTIQALALIHANPSEDPRTKTTLIVAPVALLEQWKSEIADKTKPSHALKVHRFHNHGRNLSFAALCDFDVVLTTYGTLASDLKHFVAFKTRQSQDPGAIPTPKERSSLIGDGCKFYRIILDEAQNIKNKNSNAAKACFALKAEYRVCMTGTPMMNTVYELQPLIHFCRIKPFDDVNKFKAEIGKYVSPTTNQPSYGEYGRRQYQNAMQKLQGLIRAVMLRRTKQSTLDGRPIIQLGARTVYTESTSFSQEEEEFYKKLETESQVTLKRMISDGDINRQYSHALVLLLRLRQSCCHTYLVMLPEHAHAMSFLQTNSQKLMDLARQMNPEAVARIKNEQGNFQCPICLDGSQNPAILLPCGHITCSECFTQLCDNTAQRDAGENGNVIKCPVCRGNVMSKETTDFLHFKKVHQPELLASFEMDAEAEDTSDSEDEEDVKDEADSLKDFIVDDDYISGEEPSTTAATPAIGTPSASGRATPSMLGSAPNAESGPPRKKAKLKNRIHPDQRLAQLKKESDRNKKAKTKYFKHLDRNFRPSAKITRTIQLIKQILQEKPQEKILLFSQFTTMLDLIEVPLRRDAVRYVRYDGSMTASERAKATDKFRQDPELKVMILSLKAGNAGLNLNVASQVILLDPFWNPYIEEQAIDRAHRIGQRFDVQVYRIVIPNTVEDRILKLQEKKRALIDAALSEEQGRAVGRLGQRELQFLFGIGK